MTSTEPRHLISAAETLIRQTLAGDSSGHDWWHIDRVRRVALRLAEEEQADPFVVELAALLHDIADWKFHAGDDTQGPQQAREWLTSQGVPAEIVEHVAEIIATLSFKGAGVPTPMRTIEGAVVQDADRLDAIGAVGVARAFAYGGHAGRALYDPECPPEQHGSFAAYKKNSGPTLNHFYEKLFLLKDRLNTNAAKRMAVGRHAFLETFVEQFLAEWKGER